ncbi:hypothetical protein [uncultured Croceitalea sp.]|uniref:hypothetical protein n=1 Tax=uncultured Croceitalea sp. TaxID=1798908 RepID=UPI00374ED782
MQLALPAGLLDKIFMKYITIITALILLSCNQNKYEWALKYGHGKAYSTPNQILSDFDSYYVLGANLKNKGESPYVLVKLSLEGEVLWELSANDYLESNNLNGGDFKQIVQTNTGKLFIIGTQTDQNKVSAAYLIRVSKDGKIEDKLSVDELSSFNLAQPLNGTIVVLSGYITEDTPTLLFYDENLNKQKEKQISFKGDGNTSNNLMKVHDDNIYLVQSRVSTYSGVSSINVKKLNSNGEIVWDKFFYEDDFENIKAKAGLTYNFVAGILHFSDNKMYVIGTNLNRPYSHFFSIDITSGELVSENLTIADLNSMRNCSESNVLLVKSPSKIMSDGKISKTVFTAIDKNSNEVCYCIMQNMDFPISDFYFNNNDSIFAGYEKLKDYKSKWKIVKLQQDLSNK